ncbi:tripartite tricarboxylate transporter substrate binding protein [Phycicoccus sp. M110.8]|uniref:tripartite tricarboxylate transporter substrate binding protein n=1 Tax=Phycicoccus sp. M110.8 TaxID=3075433 RepID=UPI0028FD3082|nr:tripartite tricarboxylate transporter substrate binding protein [Phycicoccus sp. M110.8]MDU0315055.1 tripartite tricarboxylate transporter substrate binding protein [Phycicoccus sp. M110.8]
MKNVRSRTRVASLVGAAALALALTACSGVKTGSGGGNASGGSDYPTKSIEMTVGASAGGSSDLISRALSKGMGEALGVAMPVVNKPGANGALVAKELKTQKPDGYSISVQNASLFAITPLAVSADEAVKADDFDIVYGVSRDDYVMATNPKTGWKSIADMKASGKTIRYGTTGVGTGAQLNSALTFATAGIKATAVPFDGGAPNLTALLGAQVDVSTMQVGEAIENIKAGKLVPLAVFSAERVPFLPDVPTAKEQGFDVQVSQYRFITTPKGTPQAVKDKLIEAAKKTYATADYKKFNEENNLTPLEVPGDEVANMLKADLQSNTDKLKKFGISLASNS